MYLLSTAHGKCPCQSQQHNYDFYSAIKSDHRLVNNCKVKSYQSQGIKSTISIQLFFTEEESLLTKTMMNIKPIMEMISKAMILDIHRFHGLAICTYSLIMTTQGNGNSIGCRY